MLTRQCATGQQRSFVPRRGIPGALQGTGCLAAKAESAGLLGVFAKDTGGIREILARAAPEQSLDRIISYMHEHYPKFADKKAIWNRAGRGQ